MAESRITAELRRAWADGGFVREGSPIPLFDDNDALSYLFLLSRRIDLALKVGRAVLLDHESELTAEWRGLLKEIEQALAT